MGAWIEIHPLVRPYLAFPVAPYVGAWIEIEQMWAVIGTVVSLPTWERGLKSVNDLAEIADKLSLPTWERGLKFDSQGKMLPLGESLPTWERGLKFQGIQLVMQLKRRSLRGSVD